MKFAENGESRCRLVCLKLTTEMGASRASPFSALLSIFVSRSFAALSARLLIAKREAGRKTLACHHHLLDLGNRFGRVEAFGADLGAVHDGVTAVEFERIL